jgi:hypothetical protein
MVEPQTFGAWIADHFYWVLFIPITILWFRLCIFGINLQGGDSEPTRDHVSDDVYWWFDGYYHGSDYYGD